MSTDVSDRLRQAVAERAYHVCEYCLIHEDDTFWGCQIDHVISRKHGGRSESDNLAWACACCNANKGSDVGTLAGIPPQLTPLFHPRTDRWGKCFHLDGVRIEGQNSVGAGTEKLLRFNEPRRFHERANLAEIGRYPTMEAMARMTE